MFVLFQIVAAPATQSQTTLTDICTASRGADCTAIGLLFSASEDVSQNDATATSLFQQGCAAGDACEKGEGVTADIPTAFGFYHLACDLRDAIGCHDLGYSYSVGFGVIQDDTLSLLLLEQGCDLGDADSCASVGLIYQTGRVVAQDFATAFDLFEKACDISSAPGCINLGQSYENGWGVMADINRAREIQIYMSERGNTEACDGLERVGQQAHNQPLPGHLSLT